MKVHPIQDTGSDDCLFRLSHIASCCRLAESDIMAVVVD